MNESILIKIDPESSTPIYMQIVEKLHGLMVAGRLSPGDPLPSVRQMADVLQVNASTVKKAYRWLADAALVSTCQGRGSFVSSRPLAALERQQQQVTLDQFARRVAREAQRLGFDPAFLAEAIVNEMYQDKPDAVHTKDENK